MSNPLMDQKCTITELPYTGQETATVIAEELACTQPMPANPYYWSMGTDFEGYEIVTNYAENVRKGQLITTNDRTFTIQRAQAWYSGRMIPFYHMLLVQKDSA